MKNHIIGEAKISAKGEASKIVSNAKVDIENQKMAALIEAKNSLGSITEKVLTKLCESNTEVVSSSDYIIACEDMIELGGIHIIALDMKWSEDVKQNYITKMQNTHRIRTMNN
jgi:hypothetical protein